MGKMTLFDIKKQMYALDTEISTVAEWISEKAADPTTPMADIEAKKAQREELVKRKEILKAEHDAMEEAQRDAVARQKGCGNGMTEKDVLIKNKAAFYRAVAFKEKDELKKSYEGLGAIPAGSADMGSGSNLLPVTISNEIITEPYEENSLRTVEQTSQIAGLEEPRMAFTIDDDDLLEDVIDFETAKEIKTSTDMVTYGRYKTKCVIKVSDTVMYGTDTALVAQVESELRSALARKEKLRAFAKSADDDHKHMSFYMVGIKGVTGSTIVNAIISALGDLDDVFRANAKVMMRSQDWYSYIQTLVNGSDTLFGKKPEDVVGVPVIFNDRASIPIVGDFRYAKQNYDPNAVLDSDKDIDNGTFKFVLTAWGDHQIKLKSAFRLASIAVAIIGGVAKPETAAHLAGEDLTAAGVFNTDSEHTPASGITYLWQYNNAGTWTDLTSSYTGYNTATLTTVDGQDENVEFRCKITYDSVSVFTNVIKMA